MYECFRLNLCVCLRELPLKIIPLSGNAVMQKNNNMFLLLVCKTTQTGKDKELHLK